MIANQDKKKSVSVRLSGDSLKSFIQIQEETGIEKDTDVIRYALIQYQKQRIELEKSAADTRKKMIEFLIKDAEPMVEQILRKKMEEMTPDD